MAKRTEYKILTHVMVGKVEEELANLSEDGWEVESFDWADHGQFGTVLLSRKSR